MERAVATWWFTVALTFSMVTGTLTLADTELPEFRSYTIYRDGSEIGIRNLTIVQQGEDTVVDIVTSIEVSVAFITVFTRDEEFREVWRGGQLVSFTSVVDDDGEDFTVEAVRDGTDIKVTANEVSYQAPADSLPATYWTQDIGDASALIHVKTGILQQVTTEPAGEKTVETGMGRVAAFHYTMTGDENVEPWFDNTGVVVRAVYASNDGSEIEFLMAESREIPGLTNVPQAWAKGEPRPLRRTCRFKTIGDVPGEQCCSGILDEHGLDHEKEAAMIAQVELVLEVDGCPGLKDLVASDVGDGIKDIVAGPCWRKGNAHFIATDPAPAIPYRGILVIAQHLSRQRFGTDTRLECLLQDFQRPDGGLGQPTILCSRFPCPPGAREIGMVAARNPRKVHHDRFIGANAPVGGQRVGASRLGP